MTERPSAQSPIGRIEWLMLLSSCALLSLTAICWSWRNHALLNYGDAVAHLHIARRVFDCHQPRFSQLGSVWLPLPHILLLPFVQVYAWWANGLAAIFPSAFAYLGACVGVYRLARHWLPIAIAAGSLAFFALNPNLLYLQTTAMTEPLFLCEMIWTTLWLVEWRTHFDKDAKKANALQWKLALVLCAAIFTRYDGWVLALIAWTCMGITLLRHHRLRSRGFWLATIPVIASPIAWFVYNAIAFDDWLYFQRGPYSAKAIEIQTAVPGFPPHPGWHNPWVSLIFYMKAAMMDASPVGFGRALLVVCLLGALWAAVHPRHRRVNWALLLALPIPFYAYSVAYGSVPIFLPVWWPHSYYNVRYGLELLPLFALCIGFAAQLANSLIVPREPHPRRQFLEGVALFILIAASLIQLIREHPIAYVEGIKNIDAHRPYQRAIPAQLKQLLTKNPNAVILMNTSVDPEIVALTGITLRQTINESDLGIYRDALAAPAKHADIIVAYDGDEIAAAVKAHPQGLRPIGRYSAPYQAPISIYLCDPGTTAGGAHAVVASLKEPQ